MRKQLSEKLKEAVASVIPVTLIVLLLQINTPMPTNMLIAFLNTTLFCGSFQVQLQNA